MAIKYNLTDNKSIYSKDNLEQLAKDFKNDNFKLKNPIYGNIKNVCENRFRKEGEAFSKYVTGKGYDEEQLNSDSTGFRVKFFKRTLIPVLLNPDDKMLKEPQNKEINVNSSRDINLESKDYLYGKTNWKNIFDEDDYYEKLAKQYEEERKKLEKKSDKSKDHNDYEGYEYGENALGKAEDEFHITSENFLDEKKGLNKEDDENSKDIYSVGENKTVKFDKIKIEFNGDIISEVGLKELSKILDYVNKILLSKKSGFSGFLEKAGYNVEKGWNFLSSSKFANWFRSEEKIKNTYLPPIDGIGRFLDKNKENLINFITKRKDYLDNIKGKKDDKIFQEEYKKKNMGLLRVKKYATMILMNILKESISLSRYEEKDREKYENNELSILLFKIYKRAWEDYDNLKSEYDNVKQSNSRNYEEENKDDEKKEEIKKQDNDEKFEVANYIKMFTNEKIANYLVMRVKMRLIEIYLKTNFFGFDTSFDNEKDEKDFEFKKKHVISIIDKQSNLKYTAKQVSDILDKDKNSSEYKNLENYFGILTENLNISLDNFTKLGKKWIGDDKKTNTDIEIVKRVQSVEKIKKDFPVGKDFNERTSLESLKKSFETISNFKSNKLTIRGRCISFNRSDFDKALKKAEEIRATYGIS